MTLKFQFNLFVYIHNIVLGMIFYLQYCIIRISERCFNLRKKNIIFIQLQHQWSDEVLVSLENNYLKIVPKKEKLFWLNNHLLDNSGGLIGQEEQGDAQNRLNNFVSISESLTLPHLIIPFFIVLSLLQIFYQLIHFLQIACLCL